jgi:hypothetical protein
VAARVASPAVQGIVVTRDMVLAFWMYIYNYSVHVLVPAQVYRYRFQIRSTIDGGNLLFETVRFDSKIITQGW